MVRQADHAGNKERDPQSLRTASASAMSALREAHDENRQPEYAKVVLGGLGIALRADRVRSYVASTFTSSGWTRRAVHLLTYGIIVSQDVILERLCRYL